jgi:maltose alpha-D-glucosyltransferase/alpha-amylase
MTNNLTEIDDHIHWYKDAIIYELHIKAFMDHNGDGIGDFMGLLHRLDYLVDLGVTAIWLLPFYPSPLRDDGYDIADYYNINPSYGKLKHLKKFIKAAHERNLKVITELVINHTSDQHPWFQRARRAPKGSVERDYYVWSDDPKKYKDVRIIFQDYEASNWSWDPVAKQYYWHRFFHHQPDLNYDNPKVQEEVFKILDYWLDMGIDGFRLDAVPYLFEREGTNCENLPETHAFLKKLRKHVDDNHSGKMLLAEANMWPEDSAAYFGDGDECHMNYHFPIMPRMFMALQMEDRYPITDIFDQTPEIPETCQWAIFLRNHDELTLEMVTDQERDYMYKVYAKNPKAKINLGIRHRLAPLMDNNRKKIELINYLLFSMPGTPVIYYGDEIGMGDNYYLGDRDGVRTPMQWSPDRNAGFSNTNPQQLYLPLILDPEYHYGTVNVETQKSSSSSLLWWMKRVINMRKKFKAFSRGTIDFLHTENSKVLAFTRSYQGQIILVVVNLSRFSQATELDLHEYAGYTPMEIFSKNEFPVISDHQDYMFTLSPYAYHWFLLKKEPSDIKGHNQLPAVSLQSWEEAEKPAFLEKLENDVLPAYLRRSNWFMENGRKIHNINIIDRLKVPANGRTGYLMILEVEYESGLPSLYQLGLTFGEKTEIHRYGVPTPQGIIAEASLNEVEGFLYDGLFDPSLQKQLLLDIAEKKKAKSAKGQIRLKGDRAMSKYIKNTDEIRAKNLLSRQHNNISVLFNSDYYLKLYRKLDHSINPDLEITQFLSEEKLFEHIPKLAGSIKLSLNKDTIVLGMAQKAVDHQTDTWTYLLDDLRRYYEDIQSGTDLNDRSKIKGSLANPLTYEDIPDEDMKLLMGPVTAEWVRLLGKRVAKMHLALIGEEENADFHPEVFSLHYQRSLYSSYQSQVRKAYQKLNKHYKNIPDQLRDEAEQVWSIKSNILTTLKQIYKNKIDIAKIRIHGDLHLGQVLFTGRDFVFVDFEGDPSLRYSERRLKRAALEDVAAMIRSFHYVAYEGLLNNNHLRKDEKEAMRPWAEKWYHYMSQIFLQAYIKRGDSNLLVPESKEDLEKIMDVLLLERMMIELEQELSGNYRRLVVPLSGIAGIMERYME